MSIPEFGEKIQQIFHEVTGGISNKSKADKSQTQPSSVKAPRTKGKQTESNTGLKRLFKKITGNDDTKGMGKIAGKALKSVGEIKKEHTFEPPGFEPFEFPPEPGSTGKWEKPEPGSEGVYKLMIKPSNSNPKELSFNVKIYDDKVEVKDREGKTITYTKAELEDDPHPFANSDNLVHKLKNKIPPAASKEPASKSALTRQSKFNKPTPKTVAEEATSKPALKRQDRFYNVTKSTPKTETEKSASTKPASIMNPKPNAGKKVKFKETEDL